MRGADGGRLRSGEGTGALLGATRATVGWRRVAQSPRRQHASRSRRWRGEGAPRYGEAVYGGVARGGTTCTLVAAETVTARRRRRQRMADGGCAASGAALVDDGGGRGRWGSRAAPRGGGRRGSKGGGGGRSWERGLARWSARGGCGLRQDHRQLTTGDPHQQHHKSQGACHGPRKTACLHPQRRDWQRQRASFSRCN